MVYPHKYRDQKRWCPVKQAEKACNGHRMGYSQRGPHSQHTSCRGKRRKGRVSTPFTRYTPKRWQARNEKCEHFP